MECSATAPGLNGRLYKSRKCRPCDACRRRKVTCDMPNGPPCHRCTGKDQQCTFEEGPGPRKGLEYVNKARHMRLANILTAAATFQPRADRAMGKMMKLYRRGPCRCYSGVGTRKPTDKPLIYKQMARRDFQTREAASHLVREDLQVEND